MTSAGGQYGLELRRYYASTTFGQIHFVDAGEGEPIFLLHQTPRSWDEYRDVIPILAQHNRIIAMDTLGFGASDSPAEPWTIELFAAGVLALADALDIEQFGIVGHHTGGVVGMEVAAAEPERVAFLVLSGVPYVDAERRAAVRSRPPIDAIDHSADSPPVTQMWRKREPYYPNDRPDLLARLVADALRVGDRVEEGHVAVNSYSMEDRIGLVAAPTLVVCGEFDSFSLPDVPKLQRRLVRSEKTVIAGTGVPSVDHVPEAFAEAIATFVAQVGSTQPPGSRHQ
ncbi:alpha/beta fold hydrolase [Rhodococcoides yunnanense]|uniref:alpha/beta fold hydrolase n=1 Tax=Rhodococcoides yunnanense TaxID=278209 RepID=UPI001C3FCCCD|nr:alpha/beta hydrolase [Rhodococcus yunnanensis]